MIRRRLSRFRPQREVSTELPTFTPPTPPPGPTEPPPPTDPPPLGLPPPSPPPPEEPGPEPIWAFSLVSRSEWNALSPLKGGDCVTIPVKKVVYTCDSGMEPCFTREDCVQRMQELQMNHMKRGLDDIAYNFVIGGDGCIYEGRGYRMRTGFVQNVMAGMRLDLAFIGKYEPETVPNHELMKSIYFIWREVKAEHISKDYERIVCHTSEF